MRCLRGGRDRAASRALLGLLHRGGLSRGRSAAGASCTVCGEKRRAQLKLVELKGRSLPFCHGCAAQVMRLPRFPRRSRSCATSCGATGATTTAAPASKVDQRIFPRERRVGERRGPSRDALRRHRPAHQARRLSSLDDAIIELADDRPRPRDDQTPGPHRPGPRLRRLGSDTQRSGSSTFQLFPSLTVLDRLAVAGRRIDLDLGLVVVAAEHRIPAGSQAGGSQPTVTRSSGAACAAAGPVGGDEQRSMRARVRGPRRS